jgi:AcrR family transcriptional regulator
VSETAALTRTERRRERVRRDILEAAQELARRDGLGGLSLRTLADQVALSAPSLYGYFPSKDAILDALFAEGYRELSRRATALRRTGDPHADLASMLHLFLDFCREDVARYQLMFTAAMPGWAPSEEAYVASVALLEQTADALAELGAPGPQSLDLWTALASGMAAQQVANDPNGDRWVRLVDDAVAMYVRHVAVAGSGSGRR